jgi:hypothetical protein
VVCYVALLRVNIILAQALLRKEDQGGVM